MRIALFGGTRGVGRHVLVQALQLDWGVKLLARNPDAVPPQPGLLVVGGDALDPGKVILTLSGCDAVVGCLGPTRGSAADVCSRWTEIVIPAMKKFSVTRLVVVTAMGVADSAAQIPLLLRPVFGTVLRRSIADKEQQELLVCEGGLDWTIIRPGGLSNEPASGRACTGVDHDQKARMISRADVARFVIHELQSGEFRGRTPYVT
ncbi:MAG: NAD(P)-dependent oxidoreductase [Spirochaetaceae bacterium]|nr:MAG: NAD(P)-dependent oxidoreductase [Spirochaetaceae bacterium]